MNKTQIARKISRALINTVETSQVPAVIVQLKSFSKLIDADRKIRLFFTSQIFSEDEKKRSLDDVLIYMKASEDTKKFLKLMISNGYLAGLKDTIKSLIILYEEKVKKVTAVVTAPVALEEKYISRLKAALTTLTDREVLVESRLDPSLIGGFIVKVGSTVYDSSLKGQLQLLRAELTRQ